MAKPRYIAPWHREGLEEADLEAMSPESAELLGKLSMTVFHEVSSVSSGGRRFFDGRERCLPAEDQKRA